MPSAVIVHYEYLDSYKTVLLYLPPFTRWYLYLLSADDGFIGPSRYYRYVFLSLLFNTEIERGDVGRYDHIGVIGEYRGDFVSLNSGLRYSRAGYQKRQSCNYRDTVFHCSICIKVPHKIIIVVEGLSEPLTERVGCLLHGADGVA